MRLTITAAAAALTASLALAGEVAEHLGEEDHADLNPDAQEAADIGVADDATDTVQDLVDDPVRDEDGLLQAESGGATPRENWMGCEIATVRNSDACQDPTDTGG